MNSLTARAPRASDPPQITRQTTATGAATAAAESAADATSAPSPPRASRIARRTSAGAGAPAAADGGALGAAGAAAAAAGVVGATSGSAKAARRAPRAPPTATPELPATSAQVVDLASMSRVVSALTATITKAVQEGKSVTSANKRLILLAAEETRRAMAAFRSLAAPASVAAAPAEASLVRAVPPAPAARAATAPAAASTEEATSDLKRELAACVREEFGRLKAELARDARRAAARAPPEPTYAQVASLRTPGPSPRPPPPTTRPAIIVAAKAAVTSQQETVEAFRRSVSFRACDHAPVRVAPVARNKLRVEFETGQQRDEALHRLGHDAAEVTAERARALRPMLLLKGITRSTPKEDLAEIIEAQNGCPGGDLKLRFIRNNTNKALYNAVVEASPDAWRKLFGLGRVCVDHQRVQAERFSPFVQCFSCLAFGHVRRHCQQGAARPCAHCAATAHQEADCPVKGQLDSVRCYNCTKRNVQFRGRTPTNHRATSASCPVLCAMRARIESRVDYGGNDR